MMQSVICSSQSSVHVSFQPEPLDTLIGYLTSYNTSKDVCLFLSTRHPTLSPPSMCVRGDARDSLPHTLCFNSFFPPLTARGRNNGIGKPLLPYAKMIQPNQCPEINTKARACQPPITCLEHAVLVSPYLLRPLRLVQIAPRLNVRPDVRDDATSPA